MPYPAYDRGLSAWLFVGPASGAPPGNRLTLESNLNRRFSSFPTWAEYRAIWIDLAKVQQKRMVVGEGLLGALRLALRVVACGNAFSLRSNRTLIEASHPSPHGQNIGQYGLIWLRCSRRGWWWGKDYSARCASPFGSLPAATRSRYARIEP